MSVVTVLKLATTSPLDGRVAVLRRAYQRQLNRRPTTLERAAMERAARLVAKAEAVAIDAAVTVDDVVRITNLARRAEVSLYALIGSPARRPLPVGHGDGSFSALTWLKERTP
jgi:hypothetical protein